MKIQNDALGIQTIEAHMLKNTAAVAVGDQVVAGQYVGKSSNSGNTSTLINGVYGCGQGGGYHLHHEVRVWNGSTWVPVDPYTYNGGMWTSPLMYGSGSTSLTYSCTYDQQNFRDPPSDPSVCTRTIGSTDPINCQVKYIVAGTGTWEKDKVKLMVVNPDGSAKTNWTGFPYSKSGWLDSQSPCRYNESNARPPGHLATFEFDLVPISNATAGSYPVYVRVHHATAGLIGPVGVYFPTTLVSPAPTSNIITTLAGDITGDGKGDVVVVTTQGVYLYRSTGSSFVYDGKIGDGIPKAGLRYRLADVEGSSRKQLITFRQDLGFFFQRYDPNDSPPLSTWYRIQDWGPRASDSIAVGDVDGNGREDIIGTRTGETFVLKAVANGNGTWLNLSTFNTSWVPYPRKLLIGEENDDAREDLLFANSDGMYYQSSSGSAFGSNNRLINQTCLPDTPYVGYFTTLHRAGVLFRSSQGMKVFTPTGGPAFNPAVVWSTWKMVGVYPLVADVNADGLDDVVAVYPDRREIAILLNEHGEGFSGPHTWYRGTGSATPFTLQPVVEDPVQALSFAIRQNPIRGFAQFTLTLPEAATVAISVYDVNGRKVADVADGPFAAGEHILSWTVNHQPAGMYFVRCITPKRSFNRKVVVLQ